MSCRVLVADPPWQFGDKLPGKGRGADKHYPTMPTRDICRFPLPDLESDAYLFMWRVAAMQQDALDVAKAWGFTVKSEIVWRKVGRSGIVSFGMGRTVRGAHESCLVATRGRPTVRSRSIRSVFDAPRERHSKKPEAFYDIVEELVDGPYVELFARRVRQGWTCLGNEVPA